MNYLPLNSHSQLARVTVLTFMHINIGITSGRKMARGKRKSAEGPQPCAES
jgi:hypothetical protein